MYDPIPLQIRGGFDGVEAASAPLRHRTAGGGDMAEKQIIVRKMTMWKGVGEAAKRIGVTGPQPGSRAPSAPVDLNDECL